MERGGNRDGGGREREGERSGIGQSISHSDPLASLERGGNRDGGGRERRGAEGNMSIQTSPKPGWGRGREGVTIGRGDRSIPILLFTHFEPW